MEIKRQKLKNNKYQKNKYLPTINKANIKIR